MLYCNINAVLPYYRYEQAIGQVQGLLESQTKPVLISHLTEVEVARLRAR